MINVYLASGWFSDEQERTRLVVLNCLKKFSEDIKLFSPKDEIICPKDAGGDFQKAVFDGNCDAIKISRFIVVNTTGKDMGTLFEAGFAKGHDVPIIYYAELPKGAKFNLMLAQSGIAVATNEDELMNILSHYQNLGWDMSDKLNYGGEIE
jgi:nucleoside 2-deoxyribosyltransferase